MHELWDEMELENEMVVNKSWGEMETEGTASASAASRGLRLPLVDEVETEPEWDPSERAKPQGGAHRPRVIGLHCS